MGVRKRTRGQGSVYKRGDWYHVCYSINGQTFRESTQTKSQEDAVAYLHRKLGRAANGELVTPDKVTIGYLLERLSDDYELHQRADAYISTLRIKKHLLPFFGLTKAAKLTTLQIQAYIKRRLTEAQPSTVNRELALIRRAFRLGLQSEPPNVSRVPRFPKLLEDNIRTGYLEPEDYRKLLTELPEDLKLLFVLGYHVGMRKTALLNLQWKQVDFEAGLIRLGVTRARNRKPMPLSVPIAEDVREYLEKQPKASPYIFARGSDRIKDFRGSWAAACKRAGVAGLHFHDLRRTAVRNMRKAGVSETMSMRISGHRTRAMLDRYDISDDSDVQEAGKKTDNYLKKRHRPTDE